MPNKALRGLYAVTPDFAGDEDSVVGRLELILRGGARIVQYRDKGASASERHRRAESLAAVCARHEAVFLVNDDPAAAAHSGAHGVHLGQSDATVAEARKILGADAIVGVTCHGSLDLALAAQTHGADYVAFGSFFPSRTKPAAQKAPLQLLETAAARLDVPIVAIGGIDIGNAGPVAAAGADCIAVSAAVFAAADPESAARRLALAFDTAGRLPARF